MIRYRTGRDIGYNPRMAQILIRNIDDAVIEALRRRAAARGTSVEEEARRILTRTVDLGRAASVRRLAEVRRDIGRVEDLSAVSDLRRDRDRDAWA
jgi:plasmid stability protein